MVKGTSTQNDNLVFDFKFHLYAVFSMKCSNRFVVAFKVSVMRWLKGTNFYLNYSILIGKKNIT